MKSFTVLFLTLTIGFAPLSARAADGCKVKVSKKTGLIEVSAKNVDAGTVKWGAAAGQENSAFFDPSCIKNGRAKKCTLADPATVTAKTPPQDCTIYVADVNGSCNAWVPGCTPTAGVASAADQALTAAAAAQATADQASADAAAAQATADQASADAAAAQATADQAVAHAAAAQATADSLALLVNKLHPSCRAVNGILWCYHPTECGRACDSTCAAVGLNPMADDNQWFAAQDTAAECQAISDAFGITQPVVLNSYAYACLEDAYGSHTAGGGLVGPIFCSTDSGCPAGHRSNMDQLGTPCGANSRRSICPCE